MSTTPILILILTILAEGWAIWWMHNDLKKDREEIAEAKRKLWKELDELKEMTRK